MPIATEVLLAEHRRIRAVVDPTVALAPRLAAEGAQLAAFRPQLDGLAGLLTGDLAQHAAKEDSLFFPAIEAVLGSPFGPTTVMRQEHQLIHAAGERFRGALAQASGPPGTAASELARILMELGDLIAVHFQKEEVVLFPIAEAQLPREAQIALGDRLLADPG